jgi:hypothetical protein
MAPATHNRTGGDGPMFLLSFLPLIPDWVQHLPDIFWFCW